ncbi:MAG: DNA repair protein RecN [Dehalococcoidales bacterium]
MSQLHIRNLATIEDVLLELGPGMTVLSGEEGAGKSLVADALSSLMGTRAQAGLVRSGAETCQVEGIFWLPEETKTALGSFLTENGLEPETDGSLILYREIQEAGRSVARVNGRAVPLSILKQIGQRLVDLHGQMDYLSLMDTARQRDLLDSYGKLMALRQQLAGKVAELKQKTSELEHLRNLPADHSPDFLRYQMDEIESAGLKPDEEANLKSERETLRHAGEISSGCLMAYQLLYDDERSATTTIYQALTALRELDGLFSSLDEHRQQLEGAKACLEETARELLRQGESIEFSSARLEEVEQRLDQISTLKRKYGGSVESVLALATETRQELAALENRGELLSQLKRAREDIESETGRLAEELSQARREAAAALAKMVNQELAQLGLPQARFDIRIWQEAVENGLPVSGGERYAYTREGIDRLEFMVVTNPGEPLRPLAAIASGGETSRVTLAIKSALKQADPVPTLVFDEIDIGIGGRSGDTVGRKLAELARFHQLLCITHLPQIACFGDVHYRLVKDTNSGRARSRLEKLEGKARLEELAAMLGSETGGAMQEGAAELLAQAHTWKQPPD